MLLEKFYLDVVTPDGDGCIGYAARLDGFGLSATAATTLAWSGPATTPALQRRSLRGRLPSLNSAGVTWKCPALEAVGRWTRAGPAGAPQTLWRDEHGSVVWQVLAPRAPASVRLGDATFEGWGYAERLRLDIAPWRLPIAGLHWGRFVSAEHSVVWIIWEHAKPRRWLWHDGVLHEDFQSDARSLVWPGAGLQLGEPRILRAGRLADTAFAHWPGMQRWLPRQILHYEESKWCSPATLTHGASAPVPGWVIHEYVRLQ